MEKGKDNLEHVYIFLYIWSFFSPKFEWKHLIHLNERKNCFICSELWSETGTRKALKLNFFFQNCTYTNKLIEGLISGCIDYGTVSEQT